MTINDKAEPRILIVGCGGIGGVLAAHFLKAQIAFSIATTNEKVRSVWRNPGPTLNDKLLASPLNSECILESAAEANAPFDFVFIAVQPPQIEEVARSLVGKLTEDGRVICLPNGLCEERLASILGNSSVIGAVVAWGASMPEAGHYRRTSSGGFLLGNLNGEPDPALLQVAGLLATVGPVRVTSNLKGARFSKLAINCAVSALGTIGGTTLGRLLVRRKLRELGLSLIREAVEVAQADGVTLEAISKVHIEKLVAHGGSRKPLSRAAQHALLLAVGSKYRKLRSSMLAAIERGREPAVDFINGEIVSLGKELKVATPYNEAATQIIWAIFRGELESGESALQELIRRGSELAQTH